MQKLLNFMARRGYVQKYVEELSLTNSISTACMILRVASHAKSNEKKISTKPSQGSLGHQTRFKTIEKGVGLPCVDFKNRSTGLGSEDQSELIPRFAFNGIHTKSGADNLQVHGLRRSPGASQVSIRKGSQNSVSQRRVLTLSNSLEHFSREK